MKGVSRKRPRHQHQIEPRQACKSGNTRQPTSRKCCRSTDCPRDNPGIVSIFFSNPESRTHDCPQSLINTQPPFLYPTPSLFPASRPGKRTPTHSNDKFTEWHFMIRTDGEKTLEGGSNPSSTVHRFIFWMSPATGRSRALPNWNIRSLQSSTQVRRGCRRILEALFPHNQ